MSSAINYLHTQLNYIADIPFNTLSYTNSLTFANFQEFPWSSSGIFDAVLFLSPAALVLQVANG